MNWIDYAVTAHGRLNGGLINDNVKYCTLSVIAPYFALCGVAIAHYSRQHELGIFHKGCIHFSLFLFYCFPKYFFA